VNGEAGIGRAEEDLAYLRGEFVTSIDFGTAFLGGFYPDISLGGAFPQFAAYSQLPAVRDLPSPVETGNGDTPAPWTGEISKPEVAEVIDPESAPTTTVYESAPGGIYETSRADTDWDRVYEEFVILNAPEGEMAVDWGDIFARAAGAAVGGLLDPFGAGRATTSFFQPSQVVAGAPQLGGPATVPTGITGVSGMAGCPPVGPKYVKVCVATGVASPLRRRRRRRLLTSSDIKDLSALKSIVGGAALQGAVVQAVRR